MKRSHVADQARRSEVPYVQPEDARGAPFAYAFSRPLNLRAYLSVAGGSPLFVAVTVVVMFLPVVVVPYAYADDYPILRMAVSGKPDVFFGDNVRDAYT